MNAHEQYQEIAALDAIGAASPDEERDLREHLVACAECRRVRDEYAEAVTLLARGLDPVPPPADLRERSLSIPLLRAIEISQATSLPRAASNMRAVVHTLTNASCNTSCASSALPRMRSSSAYSVPE